jgi:hypothetical protein
LAALKRVQTKLNLHQIPHFPWVEPDLDLGFTTIATIPLTYEQKQALRNYRLYSSRGGDVGQTASCGVIPDTPTSSRSVEIQANEFGT